MTTATLFGLCAAALVGLGLYGFMVEPQPLRKVLSFNLLGGGVFLLFGVMAKRGARPSTGIRFRRRWSSPDLWSPFRQQPWRSR